MLTSEDPSTFTSLSYVGPETRTMFDIRADNNSVTVDAWIFTASFQDGQKVDIQVNPEIAQSKAEEYANLYAKITGQLPKFLIADLEKITIHDEGENFYGGGGVITVYAGYGDNLLESGYVEELMLHEGGHIALQEWHEREEYVSVRLKDPTFISTYARNNPRREDIAESIGPYLAYRYKSARLSDDMKYVFSKVMPNRMQFFDEFNFETYPWTK